MDNPHPSDGLAPLETPIRGGTDGATLSYMGLPCPNLGTGGFTGCTVGMYASANGTASTNHAAFYWFAYQQVLDGTLK